MGDLAQLRGEHGRLHVDNRACEDDAFPEQQRRVELEGRERRGRQYRFEGVGGEAGVLVDGVAARDAFSSNAISLS